jgi:two-component system sensor histidine kinase/response regulator
MTQNVRVLIVDDEPGMRLGAERALRSFSVTIPEVDGEIVFVTDTAGTGEDALRKLDSCDLLLLDHKLPGMTGLEVLNQVTRDYPQVLTIMITAYASLETAITATKLGAYDFLAKPFTPEELKISVRKAAKHLVLLREARKLAEEKKRIRFQFISVLAHELKAPLNAIEGNLRIVREKSAGDDPQVYNQMIDRSIVRLDGMRKLILDLLDMTRIESGEKKRELADVDLVEMARLSVETVQTLAQQRKIVVELHAPPRAMLKGDRGEIEIILNNLISNAVKYNRDEGRVDVTIQDEPEKVVVRVKDTGIGMTEAESAQLFQEFVRIKNAKTRGVLGTGLGLSILKKLTQLYHGDVTVQSEPDVGSTFTAVLIKGA